MHDRFDPSTRRSVRHLVLCAQFLLVTGVAAGCAEPPPCDLDALELPPGTTLEELKAAGRYALELINADRAHFNSESLGAAPLQWDDELFTSALCHARDMCERQYFAHSTPEGWGPTDRIERASGKQLGEDLWRTAENIAYRGGYDASPDEATHRSIERDIHLAYMDECQCHDGCSPTIDAGHRRNILDPRNTHVGVGVWYCAADDRVMQTENFWRDVVPDDSQDGYCPDGATALPPDPVSLVDSAEGS